MDEKKRGRGRPQGSLQYNDEAEAVVKIVDGLTKGVYKNPNQGINENAEKIQGNSISAKQKRLRRHVTQECGFVQAKTDFLIQFSFTENGLEITGGYIENQMQDLYYGSAAKKNNSSV